jgi:hypothetical protein
VDSKTDWIYTYYHDVLPRYTTTRYTVCRWQTLTGDLPQLGWEVYSFVLCASESCDQRPLGRFEQPQHCVYSYSKTLVSSFNFVSAVDAAKPDVVLPLANMDGWGKTRKGNMQESKAKTRDPSFLCELAHAHAPARFRSFLVARPRSLLLCFLSSLRSLSLGRHAGDAGPGVPPA